MAAVEADEVTVTEADEDAMVDAVWKVVAADEDEEAGDAAECAAIADELICGAFSPSVN